MKLTIEELEAIRQRNIHYDTACRENPVMEDFARLFAHIEALEEQLSGDLQELMAERIGLISLDIRDGKLDLKVKTEIMPIMATSLIRILQIEGAPNYLAMTMTDSETMESFEVLVQRLSGETPTQQLQAARTIIEELKYQISLFESRNEGWNGTGEEY